MSTLENDKVKLLYLAKSLESESAPEKDIVTKFLQELQPNSGLLRSVVAMEEIDTADDPVLCLVKKYKPVALKVKPVLGELPERFRIVRDIKGNPLVNLPELPVRPPEFEPEGRYTLKRKEKLDLVHSEDFLWPEERKVMHWLIAKQNQAFAWDDTERGKFKEEYFPPVDIPTVPHTPWVERSFRIPPGIYDEVCKIIKRKIDAGVYEPLNSSYRSR
ncbi:hypothetical protein NP233_g12890 [Leucocoprinus birnbaumii]|uniref:Uncharacterized protein n=1 Tax=Leucocoprinus birnbaumii TaxID=56174 RepID=A0AAD5VDN1_9AGAR|nr:hypothetical protein NP233_g12890 [Leucocoprinus birnbaumii]